MSEQKHSKGKVTISGAGKLPGGVYEEVKISGAGEITGDVEARTVRVSGAGKICGSLKVSEAAILSGAVKINKDVQAGTLEISGAGKVGGEVRADRIKLSGASKIGGSIRGSSVEVSGASKIGGDVEAERFKASGAFRIDGLLNAEQIEISLRGRSKVREIGGANIRVEVSSQSEKGTHMELGGLFSLSFDWGRKEESRLEVETVEGDEVRLEATWANTVRGRSVNIGPGCRIDEVEYVDSLDVADDAWVGRRVRADGQRDDGDGPRQEGLPVSDQPPSHCVEVTRVGGKFNSSARRGRSARASRSRYHVTICGWEVRNPVAKFIAGILGGLFSVGLTVLILLFVFAIVGVAVGLPLLLVGLLLGLLGVGLPILILGGSLLAVLMAPFWVLRSACRHWRRKHVVTRR